MISSPVWAHGLFRPAPPATTNERSSESHPGTLATARVRPEAGVGGSSPSALTAFVAAPAPRTGHLPVCQEELTHPEGCISVPTV